MVLEPVTKGIRYSDFVTWLVGLVILIHGGAIFSCVYILNKGKLVFFPRTKINLDQFYSIEDSLYISMFHNVLMQMMNIVIFKDN
jgi:hypothetical protein